MFVDYVCTDLDFKHGLFWHKNDRIIRNTISLLSRSFISFTDVIIRLVVWL